LLEQLWGETSWVPAAVPRCFVSVKVIMPSKVMSVVAASAGAYTAASAVGSAFIAPSAQPLVGATAQVSHLRGSASPPTTPTTSGCTMAAVVCGCAGLAVAGVNSKRRSSCEGAASKAAVSRRGRTVAMAATGHAVIMQNKGGGHGEIGYHLARALQAKGLKVTMLQDTAAKKDKVPYSLYDADLKDVQITWIDPEDMQAYADAAAAAVKDGPPVTHIFDNYSKKPAQIEPLLALATRRTSSYTPSFPQQACTHPRVSSLRICPSRTHPLDSERWS